MEHPADETYKTIRSVEETEAAETAKANQAENNTTSEPTDGTYDTAHIPKSGTAEV